MMAKNIQIKGVGDVLKKLDSEFGTNKMRQISRNAVNKGTEKVEEKLKEDMMVFKDKGYTIKEVVHTEARFYSQKKTANAKIGWNGSYHRSSLIHLNEWGYTRYGKQIQPRGFGVITKSIDSSEKLYIDEVREVLEDAFK